MEKIVLLTDDEFALVSTHFTVKKCQKREFLIQKGDDVVCAYFVVSGLVMLAYDDANAKQHIISFAMADWWESDFLAFHNRTKATLSLQCLEDTEALCLSLEGYQTLCAGLRKMQQFFLEKSISGHISSQQRILSFLTSSATERFEQLRAQHPTLLQRVSKTLLASYLGVSRETLSRLL